MKQLIATGRNFIFLSNDEDKLEPGIELVLTVGEKKYEVADDGTLSKFNELTTHRMLICLPAVEALAADLIKWVAELRVLVATMEQTQLRRD